jgi:uncharacterized protein (DUF885 family)
MKNILSFSCFSVISTRAIQATLMWITFLAVCTTANAQSTAQSSADAAFQQYANRALTEMWREFPEQGVDVGYYKHAQEMTVPDAASRARAITFFQNQLAALAKFDPARLSASSRVDFVLIRNHFEASIWDATVFKSWEWQPSQYNVGHNFGLLLNTEYAPMSVRLRHVMARLAKVPTYYAAAKANIVKPTREHTQLAILQNRGALSVFDEELVKKVKNSTLTAAEKNNFQLHLGKAREAINDFINYLNELEAKLTSEPGSARNFRIGQALYAQKFTYDIQSGFGVDELHRRAIAEKALRHDAMEKIARTLWPKYMGNAEIPTDRLVLIRSVIDELSKRHTKREAFVETVRKQIPALERFAREKDLIDQDRTRPLIVREMPQYMRGDGAGASVSASGPYDLKANTYYNVTPLDGMSDAEAASELREYNDWTLQILNIHEAIPGHYTQHLHATKSKSIVKTIFGNGSMIEGWAVFGEKMMLDAGYGNDAPEMWLMWMKWNLRSVVNTIIDIEIQTKEMSREAALTMMMREAFQEEAEATNKWRRATLTQVQLTSYYNGYAEITALRDEIREKQGDKFSVKRFNNQFLSYGSAPVKSIRELMLTTSKSVPTQSANSSDMPSWLTAKIESVKKEPTGTSPVSIWRYEADGKTFYYVVAPCCDQYNNVLDHEGRHLCAPDGGFTGRGDNKCSSAHLASPKKQLVWQDSRTATTRTREPQNK